MNTTTTTKKALVTVPTLEDFIHAKAMQATISTLKRIAASTDDNKVREMLNGLYADLMKIDNKAIVYNVSDGYDCFLVAYSFLWDKIALQGKNINDIEAHTLKSGKIKERSIFQWSCVAVRQHIYKHGQTDFKTCYIEDLRQTNDDGETETETEILDRISYLKVNRYYDIENMRDYIVTDNMLTKLNLTPRQETILHYRMQGFSVVEIADKLKVSHQAISKQLTKIQDEVSEKFPNTVRGFKEKRMKKQA